MANAHIQRNRSIFGARRPRAQVKVRDKVRRRVQAPVALRRTRSGARAAGAATPARHAPGAARPAGRRRPCPAPSAIPPPPCGARSPGTGRGRRPSAARAGTRSSPRLRPSPRAQGPVHVTALHMLSGMRAHGPCAATQDNANSPALIQTGSVHHYDQRMVASIVICLDYNSNLQGTWFCHTARRLGHWSPASTQCAMRASRCSQSVPALRTWAWSRGTARDTIASERAARAIQQRRSRWRSSGPGCEARGKSSKPACHGGCLTQGGATVPRGQ